MVLCSACGDSFKNNHGLRTHRNKCQKRKILTAAHLHTHTTIRNENPSNPGKFGGHRGLEVTPEPEDDGWMDIEEPHVSEPEPEPLPAEPEYIPPQTSRGRPRRFPRIYKDFLPNSSTRLPHMPPRRRAEPAAPKWPRFVVETPDLPAEAVPNTLRTETNDFGLYREYASCPVQEVDDNEELDNLCDSPGLATAPKPARQGWLTSLGVSPLYLDSNNIFAPFLNATVFRLMNWFYSGSNVKSVADLNCLVNDVLLAEDFDQNHLKGFSAEKELNRLDNEMEGSSPFAKENGWKKSTIKIPMPREGVKYSSEDGAPVLELPNVYHRSLLETITSVFEDETSKSFHYVPFRMFWQATPSSPPERVVTELYNSDAFYDEHIKIMKQPVEPGQTPMETAIAAMMIYSDSAHLTNFGDASMWPGYMLVGNQSKYDRAKPSNFATHHFAYIPSLPKDFQDIYMKAHNGVPASKETITHIKREIMQAVWLLLLDDDFMYAYVHGFVMKCSDGITRRISPRFFTYSADYPEKVLLSTIRYYANCPCPRCFIPKKYINGMGMHVDYQRRKHERMDTELRQQNVETSRKWIFQHGKGVKSKAVEDILQEDSYVPTRSAFSTRLFKHGFNYFSMFVPDLLHEFELGVWKSVFTHLMRILHAAGDNCIQKLNWRYRRVQTYGRNTIRRFATNASSMTKLAARDFEDLLQCSMPVFEGLLPKEADKTLQDLLFTLCTWHAYAKLRMHTTSTLAGLTATTKRLGKELRNFVKTVCSQYFTKDLPSEEAARTRRKANKMKKGQPVNTGKGKKGKKGDDGPVLIMLNLFTYKLHALGDYVAAIWRFGPSDGYSTQTGELEHKRVKRFYARTNKGRDFERQIARHQRRQRLLRRIASRVKASMLPEGQDQPPPARPNGVTIPIDDSEALTATLPEQHHHMANSKRHRVNMLQWLDENEGDLALEAFVPRLKEHLLARLLGHAYDGLEHDYTEDDLDDLEISGYSLYLHKVLRVNYTSYDLRRGQDSVNPRTSHCDVMTLAQEAQDPDAHPYAYARVVGMFHVDVKHKAARSQTGMHVRMDVLWVRWFEVDDTYAAGWSVRRLDRLSFINSASPGAFGFLDPTEVIRAAHLISGFAHGSTDQLLGPSLVRQYNEYDPETEHEDWKYFYVNRFVDRDMFVRYLGGGIGHKATNRYTQHLRPDYHDSPDAPSGMDGGFEGEEGDVGPGDVDENSEDEEDEEGEYHGEDEEQVVEEEEEDYDGEDGEEPWEMPDDDALGYAEY